MSELGCSVYRSIVVFDFSTLGIFVIPVDLKVWICFSKAACINDVLKLNYDISAFMVTLHLIHATLWAQILHAQTRRKAGVQPQVVTAQVM